MNSQNGDEVYVYILSIPAFFLLPLPRTLAVKHLLTRKVINYRLFLVDPPCPTEEIGRHHQEDATRVLLADKPMPRVLVSSVMLTFRKLGTVGSDLERS